MSEVVFIRGLLGGYRVLMVLCLLLPLRLFAGTDIAVENDREIKVLASIKPLQLIAQAITHGVVDTGVLLPAGTTPHDYALKPSDLVRVYDADLVLWLGAPYESYLAKPVATRAADDLAVMAFDEAAVDVHHEGHEHGGYRHLYADPHVWFSPEEALAIAQTLAKMLEQRDAANAPRYNANLTTFREQLQLVDERIKARFALQGEARYLVYHDAYSHFENQYGLAHLAVVTEQPESKPGAKSLLNLRRTILKQQVKCLFTEPQADPGIVSILREDNELQVYQLDPMAGDIDVSAEGYVQFLEHTAERFGECH